MYPPAERFVIFNADDFGLTSGINRGIIETHERGVVTSASLMVRQPAAAEAAAYARRNPRLAVGLHLDLAEWRYQHGEWVAAYQVVDAADAAAVRAECEQQLMRFQDLVGRYPTHLDSHQHVHLLYAVQPIVTEMAANLRVPLRKVSPQIRYSNSFYGQTSEGQPYPEGILGATLVQTLQELPPGWTEIGCHPGYGDELDSIYKVEREAEVRVLCSRAIREALDRNGLQLRSFYARPDR